MANHILPSYTVQKPQFLKTRNKTSTVHVQHACIITYLRHLHFCSFTTYFEIDLFLSHVSSRFTWIDWQPGRDARQPARQRRLKHNGTSRSAVIDTGVAEKNALARLVRRKVKSIPIAYSWGTPVRGVGGGGGAEISSIAYVRLLLLSNARWVGNAGQKRGWPCRDVFVSARSPPNNQSLRWKPPPNCLRTKRS